MFHCLQAVQNDATKSFTILLHPAFSNDVFYAKIPYTAKNGKACKQMRTLSCLDVANEFSGIVWVLVTLFLNEKNL